MYATQTSGVAWEIVANPALHTAHRGAIWGTAWWPQLREGDSEPASVGVGRLDQRWQQHHHSAP